MPPQQMHHTFIHAQMSTLNKFFNVVEFVIKGLLCLASEVLGCDHGAQLYHYFIQAFLRYNQNQDN